jgi:2-isopropylmalate synthase
MRNIPMRQIEIYDTTLRDGAQMKGISFSVADKIKILEILDDFGLAFVEGGWPGANPKDIDFFEEAKKLKLKNTKLVAFGSTRRFDSKVEDDSILKALLRAETEVVCIVSKSSYKQIQNTLKASPEENLDMLRESIEHLRSHGRRVFVDAEHFFDGFKEDRTYSEKFIETCIKAQAETLVLCDTNGGSLPEQVYEISKELVDLFGNQIKFGIHVHNDGDLAVANSIRAVRAGIRQVQGTINGYGERCGNANLISIIPNLQIKYQSEKLICVPEEKLSNLSTVSKKIAEIANMNLSIHQPFVGSSAFTHKGGLHASAMARDKTSYEHIDPALIGNTTRFVVSEQSGMSNIADWLSTHNLNIPESFRQQVLRDVLAQVKKLEHAGYSFENADASFEILIRKLISKNEELKTELPQNIYPKYFQLIENNVHVLNGDKAEATVRIQVADQEMHTAALGNGPANALDRCLRKALENFYPEINNFSLSDFKVRIRDSHLGTAALTIVQINTRVLKAREKIPTTVLDWDTIGVSSNLIKASWDAIVDSIEYGLIVQGVEPLA